MARKTVELSAELPFHITSRTINREWFQVPLIEVWKIMEDYLYFLNKVYEFKIHAFVLMANHYHLMATVPKFNLAEGMCYFSRETSRQINKLSGRINQVYGGRYKRCLIKDPYYYLCAYKYIYRNPVESGVVKFVEEYRFSTLHGLLGQSKLIIPIEYDQTLYSSFDETLRWLNQQPEQQKYFDIKKALKKSIFVLPRGTSGVANPLEVSSY